MKTKKITISPLLFSGMLVVGAMLALYGIFLFLFFGMEIRWWWSLLIALTVAVILAMGFYMLCDKYFLPKVKNIE
jgi:ABC-type uncharacterized transport system permease subunit